MTTRTAQAAARRFTATDDELLDQLDHLVGLAALGDRAAIGAVAIAFGPTLLDEARAALGPTREQDAGALARPDSTPPRGTGAKRS
jgi:hypothetical protein